MASAKNEDLDVVTYIAPQKIREEKQSLNNEEKAILERINQKIAGGGTLSSILEFFFSETRAIFPCDRLSLAFLEGEGPALRSYWVKADYEPLYLKTGYRGGFSQRSLVKVLDDGLFRIISDLSIYAARHPDSSSTALLVREGVGSSLTCPLYVDNRIVGVLFRSSRRTNTYDSHSVFLQALVTERLAQAVEKAWRIERLEATNRAYLEMLSFASHELRAPLSTIRMEADLLDAGYAGPLSQNQKARVITIKDKIDALLERTKDYLDLAQFEGGQLNIEKQTGVRLKEDLLVPTLQQLDRQLAERKITLKTDISDGAAVLTCDSGAIRTVLLNLIGNAVKYGVAGGDIRITAKVAGSFASISVWNSGSGFPEDQRSKLFQRFSRLKLPEFKTVQGSGVGLYLTAQLVYRHGGRIFARSEYGTWAEFTFELPL